MTILALAYYEVNDSCTLYSIIDIGAAYGTAKSGVGIASMGVMHPGLVMKNIIPVVMAGVLGIYGLIVAVIIQGSSKIVSIDFNYYLQIIRYNIHIHINKIINI